MLSWRRVLGAGFVCLQFALIRKLQDMKQELLSQTPELNLSTTVNNYTGDRIHFGLATERVMREGIKVGIFSAIFFK